MNRRCVRSLLLPVLLCGLALPLFAQAPAGPTTIFLVRHAEKATDDPRDPSLTPEGEARAALLARMLADAGIDAVYATDFRRTRGTAAPLAEALGHEVTLYAEQGPALAGRLLGAHRGQQVLVAGHSNTVPMLLNALVGAARYEDLDDAEYDALFIVTVPAEGTPAVTLLRYGAEKQGRGH